MKNVIACILCMALVSSCSDAHRLSDDQLLVPLTVMEDSSLSAIDIDGVRLHSEAFGNSADPMIVVIHGGPGADYRSQLNFKQLVEDGFYVVFYDQRGCGLSERLDPDGFPDVQVYINELEGVINFYHTDDDQAIILAGHSWGAMLSIAFVNQNPNSVDGIILAEPGGFTWDQTTEYISRSRKLVLSDEATNDFVYQDQFLTGDDHNSLDYKLGLSLTSGASVGDPAAPPFWRYGSVCNTTSITLASENPDQMDFTANIKSHDGKILFAYSELNEAYGKAHAELLAASLSDFDLIEIKGCGHEIPEFGWTNFYPVVKQYLSELL